jgi:hypothetical protein
MKLRIVAFVLATSAVAHADPILGGDADLATLAASYERQQDTFARAESGQSLDTFIKPADQQTVIDFFAQTTKDFQTFSGKHPFDVIERYDEHGDMGNFSGVASVGLAARLMVLKRDGAPAADIQKARDACVRAAQTWHVFGTIAGPGTVARGVRRITPAAGEPALPGTIPALVPLKDGGGNPQPPSKGDTWRAPVASGFADWIWVDNTSKDQVAGYALAVAWLWEALHDDPAAPPDASQAIATDLVAFAKALMTEAPENGLDLMVRDADGRLTSFGDLNARFFTSALVVGESSTLKNGFNAALAMGIVRAALHVSGDAALKTFYYDELVTKRKYPDHAIATATLMYQNEQTNFSNVNMLAIALATLGRIESDVAVRGKIGDLVAKFWDSGSSRDASHDEQPWFDVIAAGFGKAPIAEVPARMKANLVGYPAVPTFQRDRINCDDTEIAAGSCLAVDGVTTIQLSSNKGRGGSTVAKTPVPIGVRPDSNFSWRSDPFGVNDGGSNRLNPRGDWLAAYWLGRLLDKDPTKNLYVDPKGPGADAGTPPALPAGPLGNVPAGPTNGSNGGGGGSDDGGCSCNLHASSSNAAAVGLAVLALLARRRRATRGAR